MEWLKYSHYEAHDIRHVGNQLIFRFVTRSGDMPGTLCVTGKIIVPGLPHHP